MLRQSDDRLPGMHGILGQLSGIVSEGPQWLDWLDGYLTEHPDYLRPLQVALMLRDPDMELHFKLSSDFAENPYATPAPGGMDLICPGHLSCKTYVEFFGLSLHPPMSRLVEGLWLVCFSCHGSQVREA
eukprot:4804200-Amphidinium_carterae.2